MSDVYQAPEAALNEPVAPGQYGSVEGALAGNYELKPIGVLKDAWAILDGMKGTFWIAAIIYGLIAAAFAFFSEWYVGSGEPAIMPLIIMQVVQTIVLAPIAMGLMMIVIKHSVGAKIEVGEIFKHFNKTLPLFIAYVLMIIAVFIGTLLFVIPGIYLLVAYSMTMMLIVEKDMGPWEALETSRKAVTKKWFNMLGFMIMSSLVIVAGALALVVGLVWAAPVAILAYGIIYRDMFGVEDKTLNAE